MSSAGDILERMADGLIDLMYEKIGTQPPTSAEDAVVRGAIKAGYSAGARDMARAVKLALERLFLLPDDRNFWYGSTATADGVPFFFSDKHNTFVSAEPLSGPMFPDDSGATDWMIVGAETGNRRGKGRTERAWVLDLAAACAECGIPVFMKSNLVKEGVLSSEELVQEFPTGLRLEG